MSNVNAMSRERELLERVLTSELWSVQEELQAEIKELLAQPEQEEQQPVATKLESPQFTAFHVSSGDFKKLQKLPVGTKLYTSPQSVKRSYVQAEEDLKREPPMTGREMYQRGYAAAERDLKREPLSDESKGITMNRNDVIMDKISDCLLDNKPLPEGYTVNVVSCEYTQYGWFDGFETKYIVTAPNGDVCNDSVELLDEMPLGEYVVTEAVKPQITKSLSIKLHKDSVDNFDAGWG